MTFKSNYEIEKPDRKGIKTKDDSTKINLYFVLISVWIVLTNLISMLQKSRRLYWLLVHFQGFREFSKGLMLSVITCKHIKKEDVSLLRKTIVTLENPMCKYQEFTLGRMCMCVCPGSYT